jgi:two-component system chemotaxis response regulator CheB
MTAGGSNGMVRRDMVVIGGSAGAHKALEQLLTRLPADLPAAVLVVLHLAPGATSSLADMLAKSCALPVRTAVDGRPAERGNVYVAVPDRHLAIDENDVLRLTAGPRENRVRPAVDALFRSAARWCGSRVAGVVLSGSLDDGAAGLAAIAERGGTTLVQDPAGARFPGMPKAALAAVPDATVAPAGELGALIADLAGRQVAVNGKPNDALIWETDMITDGDSGARDKGQPVGLGCPDCGGGMFAIRTGRAVHYVCHVGHSFSPQTLLAAKDDNIEEALWTAISAAQEKAMILSDLAARAEQSGDAQAHRAHLAEAERVARAAERLRTQLEPSHGPVSQR